MELIYATTKISKFLRLSRAISILRISIRKSRKISLDKIAATNRIDSVMYLPSNCSTSATCFALTESREDFNILFTFPFLYCSVSSGSFARQGL